MRSRVLVSVLVVLAALISQTGSHVAAQSAGIVVISQVYGAGGNSGATWRNDYVEIFNRGTGSASLAGLTVQYASATGTGNFAVGATLSGSLAPGQYHLVQMSSGGASGALLPTADTLGTSAMAAGAGKVALVAQATTIGCNGGSAPCGPAQLAAIVDLVGYGTGASGANFFEGAGQAPTTSATLADFRKLNGCTDTNNNSNDFLAAAPAPRTTTTDVAPCEGSTNPRFTATLATPSPVQQGQLLTVAATVAPGSGPISTGLAVTGDLSPVGGLVSQALFDNGVEPDASAGDNIFTTSVTVPGGNPLGSRSIALTVTDAESRTGSTTFSVTVIPPPIIRLPHEIQGAGATSPFPVGTGVTVRAVVTARKFNGFYIQTEPGKEDSDENTSEGLFVFTSSAPAALVQVGRLVEVSGTVAEFSPGADPTSPPVTELTGPTVIDLGQSTVPAAFTLTPAEVSPGGTLDQLERFEGMRVFAMSLTAISGTGGQKSEAAATSTSDGAFDVVLTGQPRPFREPGLEPGAPALACANSPGPCNIPAFDGNPERLRVDSNALDGTAIVNVSSGAVFTDVTGPLDYTFRTYTILPETSLVPVAGLAVTPAPAAGPNQFTVASFNMERFYDDVNDPGGDVALTTLAYNKRLSKASLAIRNVLNMPDIIGVQEVEKLSVLETLANRVNADAGAASPGYQAYLVEGNDQGGIDVGFLVKTAGGRVVVNSVVQVGLNATFVNPTTGADDLLNDRPPLVLRATIQGPPTSLPQHVTVIANHLRSLIDVELNNDTGKRVRAKRQAQAEFLANYIQDIQVGDRTEAVISVGDYNAFSFNDGYGDSMGTIRGEPTPADEAVTASTVDVEPNLIDLAGLISAEDRYSYVFGGNAQTLDHVIVTANLVGQFANLVHPRVNADFPEVLRGDATIPQRLSDHDPAVAYFVFPADTKAPVFSFAPQNQEAEAASAAGAVVTYAVPTATDNLDGDVGVSCAPASGATFALGNTAATCTAADAAGNMAVVSFTVTVHDTIAPELTVPANVTAQASSPAGLRVSFVASATDAVTAAPVVTCTPASGTTFPIGVTTVQCSALDAAGNSDGGSFSVTITPVVPGRMHGDGTMGSGATRVVFHLDIQESATYVDTGSLVLKIGANDFSAGVSDVFFSGATVAFAGSGSWNGHPGYVYRAMATDRGEPGRGNDTLMVVVSAPDGAVVASIGGVLASGNNQLMK